MRIEAGQRRTIWTIHSDGSGLAQIPVQPACGGSVDDPASVGCLDPRWSPDGQQIVFQRFDAATGVVSIDTVDADGSNLRQLTTSPTSDEVPDWGTAP